MRSRSVRNWAGNQRCDPTRVEHPGSTDEVAAIVGAAHRDRQRVKAIGAGHSFTAVAMTDGVLLSLDRMQSVRHVDRASGRVTVDAALSAEPPAPGCERAACQDSPHARRDRRASAR